MQMVSICVCHTYADARHMDMLNLCCILSFPGQIRKKLVPDLRPPLRGAAAHRHKMWRCSQLTMTLDVVFLHSPVTRRAAADFGALLFLSPWYTSGNFVKREKSDPDGTAVL